MGYPHRTHIRSMQYRKGESHSATLMFPPSRPWMELRVALRNTTLRFVRDSLLSFALSVPPTFCSSLSLSQPSFSLLSETLHLLTVWSCHLPSPSSYVRVLPLRRPRSVLILSPLPTHICSRPIYVSEERLAP
jgi:hypothetical protein